MLNHPIRRGLHNVQPSIFLCVFPLCLFEPLLFVLGVSPMFHLLFRNIRIKCAGCASSLVHGAAFERCKAIQSVSPRLYNICAHFLSRYGFIYYLCISK